MADSNPRKTASHPRTVRIARSRATCSETAHGSRMSRREIPCRRQGIYSNYKKSRRALDLTSNWSCKDEDQDCPKFSHPRVLAGMRIHLDRLRHRARRGALRQWCGRRGTGATRGRSGRYQRQPGLHSHAVAAQLRRGQPLAGQRSAGAAALRRLIASPNESICASECAALTVTRRRAAPFATVG